MWEVIKNLFSGGKLLEGAKSIIDEVVTSKEEKEQLYIKLQELMTKHTETVMSMEIADRDSARKREIETTRAGSKNITQSILAYIGVGGFFAIVGYLLCKGLGKMAVEESFIIGNMTGMAAAISRDIYGYYFGSSKGEDEHKQILSDHYDSKRMKEQKKTTGK